MRITSQMYLRVLGDYDRDRVKFMVTQKVGDEYEEGMELLRELYAKVHPGPARGIFLK